jgi:tRNA (guanine-N7-)-methyltransferase
MSLALDPRHTGFAPLDFEQFFGNRNPVVLEIGSGSGRFLVTEATGHPDRNYLGIEKSLHYHRMIHGRIERRGITNVRLVNHDAFVVLQKMIGDATLAEIHIYFPDPWPRPKEQKRRIIRPEALEEMRRTLVPGGLGIFVTDHGAYYKKAAPLIEQFFDAERRIPGPDDPPRTNYEAKYREEGREIYEVRFVKKDSPSSSPGMAKAPL